MLLRVQTGTESQLFEHCCSLCQAQILRYTSKVAENLMLPLVDAVKDQRPATEMHVDAVIFHLPGRISPCGTWNIPPFLDDSPYPGTKCHVLGQNSFQLYQSAPGQDPQASFLAERGDSPLPCSRVKSEFDKKLIRR